MIIFFIIKLSKKIFLSLLFTIFFICLNQSYLKASEKIATVVKVQNTVYAVNIEGEERLLKLYDSIYLNDKIITDDRSTTVLQYLDNSTIILKKKSSIKVTDFILGTAKNLFSGVIDKGSAIIESGKIAKDSNSKMEIKLTNMSLNIRGTRFNIGQKEDGSYDVGLSEDSFGNVGTINVSTAGTVKTLFDPKQVISVNSDQIVERPQTDIEKDELDEVTQDFVDVKIINEEDIQKTLESQLFSGDIIDINNDGQIDLLDVEVIKESIVVIKQETIDFIVENSKEDNINFLSNVLNESDEKNVGQSIDKIFDTKNDLLTGVLTGLSNTGNKFITSSDSKKNNEIKEKIFTQLLSGSEQTEKKSKNIQLMSKIITKSDVKSIENIVNIVKTSNASEANSNLSLQILSSVADSQSEESISLENEEQTQVNRLIEEAVASAAANNNVENSALIANVITKSNVETITQVVDNIKKNNVQSPNAGLSLQVLSDVQVVANNESLIIESNKQTQINRLLEEAIAAAAAEAAAILAAEEAADQAAAEAAAAILAADQAAAEAAAAILAAEEATILAEAEAAETLAAEEAAAQAIANANASNLTAKCNAAIANVQNIEGTKIMVIMNRDQTQSDEQAALILYNNAKEAVKQYVSPITAEEFAELDQLRSTRDTLKISYDITVLQAEDASITLTNLNITLAAAINTRNTLCAQAATAQSAATP